MKKYKFCEYPECDCNSLNNRIQTHHIIPRSKGGSNHPSNLFDCCPNHHSKLYILEEKHGIHSDKIDGSIIILGKLSSTNGKILHYIKCNDNKEYYYCYRTKEYLKLN